METLYAYLAGAIDIDGRISISRARDYRRGDREMAYYSAVISLSDSDPVLPDLLQATFPASRLQYEAKNEAIVSGICGKPWAKRHKSHSFAYCPISESDAGKRSWHCR